MPSRAIYGLRYNSQNIAYQNAHISIPSIVAFSPLLTILFTSRGYDTNTPYKGLHYPEKIASFIPQKDG